MKYIFPILAIMTGILIVGVAYVVHTDDVDAEPEPMQVVQAEDLPEDIDIENQVHLQFVSGTEYVPSDPNGRTIIQLQDFQGNAINTSCYVTIINPDRTIYDAQDLMTFDGNTGSYWDAFTTSSEQGIYEQSVECIINNNKNVTSGKAFHVANISTIIQTAEVNIQQSIDTIYQALNCTLTPNITLCEQLNNINNITTIIINNQNSSASVLNFSEEVIVQINESLTTQQRLFYEIEAPNCHVLTTWNYTALVTDERGHSLPYLSCELSSDRFGTESVPYNPVIGKYQVLHNCSAPAGIVNWNFTCSRNY